MTRRAALFAVALLWLAAPTWASSTDFTVRGTGSQSKVELPHKLTAGDWTITASVPISDTIWRFSIWPLDPYDGPYEILSIEDETPNGRIQVRVGTDPAADFPVANAYVDPTALDPGTSWRIRFTRGGFTPDPDPEPEPPPVDDAPCDAAGEGVNLLGHQVFMCIVANGQVHQLPVQKLSDNVAVFGRRSDPKAIVKLVGGCTWGAVAAVTTARRLQIRVYNTANGNEWEHNHNRSGLAPSGYAGNALCDEAGN